MDAAACRAQTLNMQHTLHNTQPSNIHIHTHDTLAGKRVVNLLGSNGTKAVAMALLGAAHVTVIDVSPGNAAWGGALAAVSKGRSVVQAF